MVRLPPEQVVEAILGVVRPIIEDEGGGKDVEDFYRVGVIMPNGITKELFNAGQIAAVNADQGPLDLRGLSLAALESLTGVEMLLCLVEELETPCGPRRQQVCRGVVRPAA